MAKPDWIAESISWVDRPKTTPVACEAGGDGQRAIMQAVSGGSGSRS